MVLWGKDEGRGGFFPFPLKVIFFGNKMLLYSLVYLKVERKEKEKGKS